VTIALSRAELASLTGKVRPSAQARMLDGMDIPYLRGADGSISVLYATLGVPEPKAPPVEPAPKRVRASRQRLLTLDELAQLPEVPMRAKFRGEVAGVYFLWDGDTLAYIGKAVDVDYRVWRQHRRTKAFTRATWLAVDAEYDRKTLEGRYVWRYRPSLNETRHG
jgi:hypothetical protein